MASTPPAEAIIFDMDGVLIDSEGLFDETLQRLAIDCGSKWSRAAQQATMGMGSSAACHYMHEVLGFKGSPAEIEAELDRRIIARYQQGIPEIPGAIQAVRRLWADGLVLGIASSSNRCLIDVVLAETRLTSFFSAVVSAENVPNGKPAPDVYLEAACQLQRQPYQCVAIEDSMNGIMSAHAAGLKVIVLPHALYRPPLEGLAIASVVLTSLDELSSSMVHGLM